MTKHYALIPDYMKSFQCIGSACEDSCCHGFGVEIDKLTYLKYAHTKEKELKPILNTILKLIDKNRTDMRYAYLDYLEDKRCPMLTEELSLTCHSYPRVTNELFQQIEKGATTSCPEIAHLALLNQNGISFEQFEEDDTVRNSVGFTNLYNNIARLSVLLKNV
jgi:lysine-N-methylase